MCSTILSVIRVRISNSDDAAVKAGESNSPIAQLARLLMFHPNITANFNCSSLLGPTHYIVAGIE